MSKMELEKPVFYVCPICGNMVEMIFESGQPLICCGQEMKEVEAGSTDASKEKHVPVYECSDHKVKVKVGSAPHPMEAEHHISWVELVTDYGIQRKPVYPKAEPTVCFAIGKNETVKAVYAYCNLHGLWMCK